MFFVDDIWINLIGVKKFQRAQHTFKSFDELYRKFLYNIVVYEKDFDSLYYPFKVPEWKQKWFFFKIRLWRQT